MLTETVASAPGARLELLVARTPTSECAGVAVLLPSINVDIRARVRKRNALPVHDVDIPHRASVFSQVERVGRRPNDIAYDVHRANE